MIIQEELKLFKEKSFKESETVVITKDKNGIEQLMAYLEEIYKKSTNGTFHEVTHWMKPQPPAGQGD